MIQSDIDYQRIANAIAYLSDNFIYQPSLEEVAAQVHLSPHHFQRVFSQWAGVSPKKFMQYLSLEHLRERIYEMPNLQEAAEAVGYSAQSRVYDLFVSIEGVTPQEYKSMGKGLEIHYGFHQTPYGICMIAATERGICALAFVEEENKQEELKELTKKWQAATLVSNPAYTKKFVKKIFERTTSEKIHLFVKGTNFQLKVWEALLSIPSSAVTTYQQIAKSIDKPKAVRAVGTAIGQNPVGYLIPCHRVIRKEGKIGQYRWGRTRKQAILGCEMAGVV